MNTDNVVSMIEYVRSRETQRRETRAETLTPPPKKLHLTKRGKVAIGVLAIGALFTIDGATSKDHGCQEVILDDRPASVAIYEGLDKLGIGDRPGLGDAANAAASIALGGYMQRQGGSFPPPRTVLEVCADSSIFGTNINARFLDSNP